MRTSHLLFRLVPSLLAFLLFAASSEAKTFQLQAALSLPLGPGISGGYHYNDMFNFGLDYLDGEVFLRKLPREFDTGQIGSAQLGTLESVKANLNYNFKTILAYARLRPWEGSFYFQGGLAHRMWDLEMKLSTSLLKEELATANINFPRFGTYFSLGWNWIADFGLSGGLGLGMVFGDAAEIKTSVNPTVSKLGGSAYSLSQEDLDQINQSAELFRNVPSLYCNLGWTF